MKYKLTDEKKTAGDTTLYRIQALKDFAHVKAGDLGGWIESEKNLSQKGDCWVSGNARVFDNAMVYDNAWVFGDAEVSRNARVCGDARVYGDAEVCGKAKVGRNDIVNGSSRISGLVDSRQRSEWIPVSEKLPDDTELYLIKTIFDDSHYALQRWDEVDKAWLGDDYSFDIDEVTHYMPIPKLRN